MQWQQMVKTDGFFFEKKSVQCSKKIWIVRLYLIAFVFLPIFCLPVSLSFSLIRWFDSIAISFDLSLKTTKSFSLEFTNKIVRIYSKSMKTLCIILMPGIPFILWWTYTQIYHFNSSISMCMRVYHCVRFAKWIKRARSQCVGWFFWFGFFFSVKMFCLSFFFSFFVASIVLPLKSLYHMYVYWLLCTLFYHSLSS